jgi:hypothetical protein
MQCKEDLLRLGLFPGMADRSNDQAPLDALARKPDRVRSDGKQPEIGEDAVPFGQDDDISLHHIPTRDCRLPSRMTRARGPLRSRRGVQHILAPPFLHHRYP